MINYQEIKRTPSKFVWGKIIKHHEIGNFAITEYEEILNNKKTDKIGFHIWINEKDMSISCNTLDEALIVALARKYDGTNSQAGHFICKILGLYK